MIEIQDYDASRGDGVTGSAQPDYPRFRIGPAQSRPSYSSRIPPASPRRPFQRYRRWRSRRTGRRPNMVRWRSQQRTHHMRQATPGQGNKTEVGPRWITDIISSTAEKHSFWMKFHPSYVGDSYNRLRSVSYSAGGVSFKVKLVFTFFSPLYLLAIHFIFAGCTLCDLRRYGKFWDWYASFLLLYNSQIRTKHSQSWISPSILWLNIELAGRSKKVLFQPLSSNK